MSTTETGADPAVDGLPLARSRRIHPAWTVAAITFVTMLGAAGFRSVPSALMDPLHMEFGWSHATIGSAMSVNMTLFGLMSPFAAALMDRFGIRPVVSVALLLVAAGSGLTIFMTSAWQLLLLWGVLVGIGTGSMSMAFVATVSTRWFVARRGLVSGVLTAANATGQLVFLPVVAALTEHHGWRPASVTASLAALLVVPLVLFLMRDHPHDLGVLAYGATAEEPGPPRAGRVGSSAGVALGTLTAAVRRPIFWLLAGSFAICGATTNGLVGTHFIPAAHDHGMPVTTAAGLLALVGVFDVAGTIASGWLTDRIDPRVLLLGYYAGRGLSLLALPSLLSPHTTPSTWVFILFYGLDWVATVPPTVALCRQCFGDSAPIVFGWVFAAHQIGAALAAGGAGWIRDTEGSYDLAFYLAAGLCALAAMLCLTARRGAARRARQPVDDGAALGAGISMQPAGAEVLPAGISRGSDDVLGAAEAVVAAAAVTGCEPVREDEMGLEFETAGVAAMGCVPDGQVTVVGATGVVGLGAAGLVGVTGFVGAAGLAGGAGFDGVMTGVGRVFAGGTECPGVVLTGLATGAVGVVLVAAGGSGTTTPAPAA